MLSVSVPGPRTALSTTSRIAGTLDHATSLIQPSRPRISDEDVEALRLLVLDAVRDLRAIPKGASTVPACQKLELALTVFIREVLNSQNPYDMWHWRLDTRTEIAHWNRTGAASAIP
jgi:hypothetical protein